MLSKGWERVSYVLAGTLLVCMSEKEEEEEETDR
jgi:hypothetical protein